MKIGEGGERMGLKWEPLSMERREDYGERFGLTPERSAHYTFASLWGWNVNCGYEWAWDGPLVWIRANIPSRLPMAPVGDWNAVDWGSILPDRILPGTVFYDVPTGLARLWEQALPGRVESALSRREWEYVHRVENLVALRGNRFRTKAQKLKRFMETFRPEFVPIGAENLDEVRAFQDEWCREKGCGLQRELVEEDLAIKATLNDWHRLPGLFGGMLKVAGRTAAYTLAEPLDGETVVIRFEKASGEFRDAYQAVNRIFLERACGDYTWVNREEDMGDPGMREAKMSYRPDRFLEKVTARIS